MRSTLVRRCAVNLLLENGLVVLRGRTTEEGNSHSATHQKLVDSVRVLTTTGWRKRSCDSQSNTICHNHQQNHRLKRSELERSKLNIIRTRIFCDSSILSSMILWGMVYNFHIFSLSMDSTSICSFKSLSQRKLIVSGVKNTN